MVLKRTSYVILVIGIIIFLSLEAVQKMEEIRIHKMLHNLKLNPTNSIEYNYLEIPSLKLKQIIVKGINKENLDQNFIVTNDEIKRNCNITLVGHSIKSVFGKLHNIKIKDIIYINGTYEYEVVKKELISDYEYEKLSKNKNTINLITCMLNPKKRLLVIAKLKD